jgi:hypothetical protein
MLQFLNISSINLIFKVLIAIFATVFDRVRVNKWWCILSNILDFLNLKVILLWILVNVTVLIRKGSWLINLVWVVLYN